MSRATSSAPAGVVAPVIFEQPELQARGHRWMYSVLALIAWVVWAYLWLPLVTLFAWYLGVRSFVREFVVPDAALMLQTGILYLGIIIVLGTALIAWSRYNLARFGGRERRSATQPVDDRAIADWFGVTPEALEAMRGRGSIRMVHDEDGGIRRVVTRRAAATGEGAGWGGGVRSGSGPTEPPEGPPELAASLPE
jgi:biofilm PGA synthesis protein PgaD